MARSPGSAQRAGLACLRHRLCSARCCRVIVDPLICRDTHTLAQSASRLRELLSAHCLVGRSSRLLPRIGPLRPPGGGFKGLSEVLRLEHDVGRAKHHDAHGVVRLPVVADD